MQSCLSLKLGKQVEILLVSDFQFSPHRELVNHGSLRFQAQASLDPWFQWWLNNCHSQSVGLPLGFGSKCQPQDTHLTENFGYVPGFEI